MGMLLRRHREQSEEVAEKAKIEEDKTKKKNKRSK